VPSPHDFRVDPATGFVKHTYGLSTFDNPASLEERGFVPHEIDVESLNTELVFIHRGRDRAHYEIVPAPGVELTPQQYTESLTQIRTKERSLTIDIEPESQHSANTQTLAVVNREQLTTDDRSQEPSSAERARRIFEQDMARIARAKASAARSREVDNQDGRER
jgi:hypothetical protein